MRLFRKQYGFEKVSLAEEDKKRIDEQLQQVDENRLLFFSYIITIALTLMLILDFFYFDEALLSFYLIFDSLLLLVVLLYIGTKKHADKKRTPRNKRFIKAYTYFLPFFFLFWATAICALDPESLLNIVAFYFVLFILAFAVITPLKMLVLYYFIIFAEYTLICVYTGQLILTENTVVMLLVCFLVLPFYQSFRSNRINAQAALLLLDTANKNLESEVDLRTRELQHANSNLKEEIGFRKLTESKLRDALKRAELNNQLKSEFIANISHEIRTPLNAIIGFTEMITDDSISPIQKKMYQELVDKNTELLIAAIDDIFSVSLVKTGQIVPVIKPFSVRVFMNELFREMEVLAARYERKNIRLLKNIRFVVDFELKTDSYYLKKALLRLIDNALKFTPEGSVELGAERSKEGLVLYVNDTGIGVSSDDAQKIFEPFVQVDGSLTRSFGGSGLGLTIAKGIAEALNARLVFESALGKGSKFSLLFGSSLLIRN